MKARIKLYIILAVAIVLFLVSLYLVTHRVVHTVFIDGKTFDIEVANTPELLEKGLSRHMPLAANTGMLFVFRTPGNYGFWMKDMNFPLDIVWISRDAHINHIENSLLPSTFPSVYYGGSDSMYVLEIQAGSANSNNFKIGDKVNMKNI